MYAITVTFENGEMILLGFVNSIEEAEAYGAKARAKWGNVKVGVELAI